MPVTAEALHAEETAAVGRQATGYLKPPQEIIDLVDIPPEPNLSFSPDRTKVLQLYKPSPLPPISELARPELKLAGECPLSVSMTSVKPASDDHWLSTVCIVHHIKKQPRQFPFALAC